MKIALFGKAGAPLTEAAARVAHDYELVRFDDGDAVKWLQATAPDVLLSAGYGRLLSAEALAIPKIGAVNVHPSLLPDYKGSYPVFWAFYEGRDHIGMTIHEMVVDVDAGDVLAKAPLAIDPNRDDPRDAYDKVIALGEGLLRDVLHRIAATGAISGSPQPSGGCFRGVPWRELDRLAFDWSLPAREIARRHRVFPEWMHLPTPGEMVYARSVEPVAGRGEPGRIVRRGIDTLTVQAADGAVKLSGLRRRAHPRAGTARLRSFALGLRVR